MLYAVEWTRKEPNNPTAWDQLRMGYMYLRQYDDALSAATKAVTLAPDDARLWRNVGEINLDIDDPRRALQAFEQAATRNPHDVAEPPARRPVAGAPRPPAGGQGGVRSGAWATSRRCDHELPARGGRAR